MNKPQRSGWIIIILGFAVMILMLFRTFPQYHSSETTNRSSSAAEVSLIELSGIITSANMSGFGSSSSIYPSGVKELLDQARLDSSPVLVMTISSPGGSVAPTQEIYDHLIRFKTESNKKIYVWMKDVAASGGYYIACPADKIFAMPSTITGSIGVILQLINYEEMLKKIGIKEKNIKSGQFKDMGSPGAPLSKEAEEMLQSMVDDQYELFFQTVLRHRDIPETLLKQYAQGQIFTGRQAKENGLVDEVMGWYELEDYIKEEMGWTEDIHWLRYKIKSNFWSWFESKLPLSDLNLWNTLQKKSGFELQYRWKP